MPKLIDAWRLDRAPGAGKVVYATAGDATTAVGISGLTVTGHTGAVPASTAPTYISLPEAGSVIPPTGSSDRASYLVGLNAAVGFDGSTCLTNIPSGTDATSIALSCWINYGITDIVGWTPNPLQGAIYETNFQNLVLSPPRSAFAILPNSATTPIIWGSDFYITATPSGTIAWPADTPTSTGWVHVMFSYQVTATTDHCILYLNDTLVYDSSISQASGTTYDLSFSHGGSPATLDDAGAAVTKFLFGDNGNEYHTTTQTDFFKGAVAEFWLKEGKFIDWNQPANRNKFQITDGFGAFETWAPCDLGTAGTKPGFGAPTVYLSGGSSTFPYNRAKKLAKLTVVTSNLSPGLFDVIAPES
jgi:hypothetical protein